MKMVLKSLVLISLGCTLIAACGQVRKNESEKDNPIKMESDIISVKTGSSLTFSTPSVKTFPKTDSKIEVDHINIPGTRVLIVCPPGFIFSKHFTGLSKDNGSTIQFFDNIGSPYQANVGAFVPGKFESEGAKVFEFKETKIKNYTTKYMSMQEDAKTKGFAVFFGDSAFSSMIIAHYPTNDTLTGKQIRKAIFSLGYDRNIKMDLFAGEKFSLNDSESKFKFSRSSSGLLIYSIGGVFKDNYNDVPFITATFLPMEKKDTRGIVNMMIEMLEAGGLSKKKIVKISNGPVNTYSAYELEMTGKLNNKKYNFYYLVTSSADKAILMQARYSDSLKELISEIKKLSHTVNIK